MGMKKGEVVFIIILVEYVFGFFELKQELVVILLDLIVCYEVELVFFIKVREFLFIFKCYFFFCGYL